MGRLKRRIIVKVIGSGTNEDPFRVDLPRYTRIRRLTPPNTPNQRWEVETDDDILDKNGKPDVEKLREKYRGQQGFGQGRQPDV